MIREAIINQVLPEPFLKLRRGRGCNDGDRRAVEPYTGSTPGSKTSL